MEAQCHLPQFLESIKFGPFVAQYLPLPARLHLPGSSLDHHQRERRGRERGKGKKKRESQIEEEHREEEEGRKAEEAWRKRRRENE